MAQRLLGVDVGIVHLALVSVTAWQDTGAVEVTAVRLIDLTTLPCPVGCTLRHSNNIVDRMEHLFAAHEGVFAAADEICIERQPLGGLVHVEALIYSRFRAKAQMVSPNAMHHHFGLPRDYDARKVATVALAAPYLTGFQRELAAMPRVHDVADAVCLCLFYTRARHARRAAAEAAEAEAAERRDRLELLRAHDNPLNPFSKFAIAPSAGRPGRSPPRGTGC